MERLARDKLELITETVNYGRNEFYDTDPSVRFQIIFGKGTILMKSTGHISLAL
jgi:hypothetical protein